MSYGDIAEGVIYLLDQQLADARSQIAHDARRARVAEARLQAVQDILETADRGHRAFIETWDLRDALDTAPGT